MLVVQSCLTPCDPMGCANQTPPPMGFFRQEYWSGLPCPPPGDLSNPGIEPRSPTFQADSLPSEPPGKPRNTEMGSLSSSGYFSISGITLGFPALQVGSLQAELLEKLLPGYRLKLG